MHRAQRGYQRRQRLHLQGHPVQHLRQQKGPVTALSADKKGETKGLSLFPYLFILPFPGHFAQRQRKVTICALVQSASGLKAVSPVPCVTPVSTAHCTAAA